MQGAAINKNWTGNDIFISHRFAAYENKGTTSERGSHAVSFTPNHILSVMEGIARVICVPLYFLPALLLVHEYAAVE